MPKEVFSVRMDSKYVKKITEIMEQKRWSRAVVIDEIMKSYFAQERPQVSAPEEKSSVSYNKRKEPQPGSMTKEEEEIALARAEVTKEEVEKIAQAKRHRERTINPNKKVHVDITPKGNAFNRLKK